MRRRRRGGRRYRRWCGGEEEQEQLQSTVVFRGESTLGDSQVGLHLPGGGGASMLSSSLP